MSVSISASTLGSTCTITVGTAGTFTNASSVDISTSLNSEIAATPTGDRTVIDFEPGNYGDGAPIFLSSNTSVVGDDSTLTYVSGVIPYTNWAMLCNVDTHGGPWPSIISDGVVSQNISVMGMSFVTNNADIFGTSFMNAANIDVQNNIYVSGRDGNAFISVINGIVANNVAFGMDNGAYDDWNGPVNVTLEDNSGYVYGNVSSGWNVLLNSSLAYIDYAGDAAQYGISVGDDYNDAAVDNDFSTNWAGGGDVDTDALLDHGYTTETNMTQQGNVYQGLGVANSDFAYVGSPMTNSAVEDNSFVGLLQTGYGAAAVNEGDANTPTNENINPQVIGNLVLGLYSQNVEAVIWNAGLNPTTDNNADIGENLASTIVNSADDGTTIQSAGNIINTGSTTSGSGVIPSLDIEKPATLLAPDDSAILVSGLEIEDISGSSTVSATVTTTFGTLSLPAGAVGVNYTSIVGEEAVVFTGSLSDVNDELANLSYTSNPDGWDDAIEIRVSDSAGFSATSYIPVTVGDFGSGGYDGVLTFTPGEILPELDTATIPEVSTLSSDTVVGVTGNNVIQMGTTVSIVFLDAGSDTIIGGSNDAYITTGQGQAVIELTGGGNASISGGSGSMTVNAATGNNVVASGSSNALFIGGPGVNTVAGGLGDLTVQGGSGSLYLATLPQDGGDLTANLGSGNSTVFALSGNDYAATQSDTENFIDLGIGNDCIASAGADFIPTGAGNDTIDASAGGSDSVLGGTGSLFFIAGTGDSFVDPAAQSTILAGAGDLTIGVSGNVNLLQIKQIHGTSRVIVLDYAATNVALIGYNPNAIVSETLIDEFLNVTLTDGTLLKINDPKSLSAIVVSGTLGLVPWSGLSTPDVINIDSMLDNVNTTGTAESQMIETAESEVPSGSTAVLYTNLPSPGGLVNNGSIVLDPTNFTLDNPLTGDGVIEIESGSVLQVNGSVAATQTISFVGTIGSLILGDAEQFFGTIAGFMGYNTIDFSNDAFSSVGFATLSSGNVLDVVENGKTVALQLDPLQSYAGNAFTLSNDGLGGTSITDATDFAVSAGVNNLFVDAPAAESIFGNGGNDFSATFGSAALVSFNSEGGSGTVSAGGKGDYVNVSGSTWSVAGNPAGGVHVDSSATVGAQIEVFGQGNAVNNAYGADSTPSNLVGLAGDATVISSGTNDLIETFAGNDIVIVKNSANIIVNGGADTVYASATSSGVNAFFSQGGGTLDFINSSTTSARVSGGVPGVSGGSVTAFGGSGGGVYIGGSAGNNSLVGGTGIVDLVAQGTNNFMSVSGFGNSYGMQNILQAGAGGASMVAASTTGFNEFYGGEGTDSIISFGLGEQTYYVGTVGVEIITGSTQSGASNQYIFDQDSTGAGQDVITNFRPGIDHIDINPNGTLSGVSINGCEALGGASSGAVVYLSDGTTIQLYGVSVAALQAASIAGGLYI